MGEQEKLLPREVVGYASGKLAFPAFVALPFLFLFGLSLAFTEGFTNRFYIFTVGSLLSVLGFQVFALAIGHGKKKSYSRGFAAVFAFVLYLVGCYVVFYEGFWRLHLLRDGFSLLTILASLFFIVSVTWLSSAFIAFPSSLGNLMMALSVVEHRPVRH
jgi:hypothetical protein